MRSGKYSPWSRGVAPLLRCLCLVAVATSLHADEAGKRTAFHDNRVSIELPDGWAAIERPESLAAFAAKDKRSSLFVTLAAAGDADTTMDAVLERAVADFREVFEVGTVAEYRWGKVQGPNRQWNAVFTTLELELKAQPANVPFRYYLTVFETATHLYLVQSSTMKPVDAEREREILGMIRSLIAHP